MPARLWHELVCYLRRHSQPSRLRWHRSMPRAAMGSAPVPTAGVSRSVGTMQLSAQCGTVREYRPTRAVHWRPQPAATESAAEPRPRCMTVWQYECYANDAGLAEAAKSTHPRKGSFFAFFFVCGGTPVDEHCHAAGSLAYGCRSSAKHGTSGCGMDFELCLVLHAVKACVPAHTRAHEKRTLCQQGPLGRRESACCSALSGCSGAPATR